MRNLVLAAALAAGGFAAAPAKAADVSFGLGVGPAYGGYDTVGYRGDRDWDDGDRGWYRGGRDRDRERRWNSGDWRRDGGWRGWDGPRYRRSYYGHRPYYRPYRPYARYYGPPRPRYEECRTTRYWNGYETVIRRVCD